VLCEIFLDVRYTALSRKRSNSYEQLVRREQSVKGKKKIWRLETSGPPSATHKDVGNTVGSGRGQKRTANAAAAI
jgi:hypothetical protein